jgi:hypothetical protein
MRMLPLNQGNDYRKEKRTQAIKVYDQFNEKTFISLIFTKNNADLQK